jgi:hypothetical protein
MGPVEDQLELYYPKEKNTNVDFQEDPEYAKLCRIVTANYISMNNKADPNDTGYNESSS